MSLSSSRIHLSSFNEWIIDETLFNCRCFGQRLECRYRKSWRRKICDRWREIRTVANKLGGISIVKPLEQQQNISSELLLATKLRLLFYITESMSANTMNKFRGNDSNKQIRLAINRIEFVCLLSHCVCFLEQKQLKLKAVWLSIKILRWLSRHESFWNSLTLCDLQLNELCD